MISLNLVAPPKGAQDDSRFVSVDTVERDAARLMADIAALLDRSRQRTITVPAEALFHARDAMMPPERMGVLAGRTIAGRFVLGSLYDVTGAGSHAHVAADPAKLAQALIAFERSGAALAGWVHSHPGSGALATAPSSIDRQQYGDWVRDFSPMLLGLIVVRDGFVRCWGDAVERNALRIEIEGAGVERLKENRHVYRLVG